jgi:MFS family permease
MNQFCGINAILFYSNQLFLDISSGNVDYAVKKSLELGVFQIIVTIISGAIMDKFGRRSLMICG